MLYSPAFSFSSGYPLGVLPCAGLRLGVLRQFQAFLASSACAACASSYHFSSIASPPWRSAFSRFAPVVNLGFPVLASGSNCAVKPTRLRRAAYFRSLERKENFLRYLITYKIKTGEKNSLGQIELELDKEPTFMDEAILDAAMKDSIKLTESRMIALSIKSIQPINWSLFTTNSTISSEIHMKNYLLPLITIFFFVGCASNSSNVVPSGNETYTVSASRPVVGVGYSTGAQESVYEQANTFCKNKDLNFEVVQFTQNPSSFGRAANATLQFRSMKK